LAWLFSVWPPTWWSALHLIAILLTPQNNSKCGLNSKKPTENASLTITLITKFTEWIFSSRMLNLSRELNLLVSLNSWISPQRSSLRLTLTPLRLKSLLLLISKNKLMLILLIPPLLTGLPRVQLPLWKTRAAVVDAGLLLLLVVLKVLPLLLLKFFLVSLSNSSLIAILVTMVVVVVSETLLLTMSRKTV